MPQNKYPILRKTSKGHSYFDLISKFWRAKKYGVNRTFHRLCSLMRKMESQCVFIEHLKDYSPELLEEQTALNTYYDGNVKMAVFRFTFLSDKVLTVNKLVNLPDEKFLASAILINFKDLRHNRWHSYLYEAIVCRPKLSNTLLLNNYIHIRKDFNCSIDLGNNKIRSFKINGALFCQQNNVTSVCAHASLCMLINNMDRKRRKVTTEWINKNLGIDHINRKVGGNTGLSSEEVIQVLKAAGLKAAWHDFFERPDVDYAEYLYHFVEGGCPALLVFTTKHRSENDAIDNFPLHVVPVIGHTLNSDTWVAEAELAYKKNVAFNYRPASEWVDHFIIHDDNFGMYLCLPIDSLRKVTLPKYDPILRAYLAIAVTPILVRTPAGEAEDAGAMFIRALLRQLNTGSKLNIWLRRLADTSTPMVIRTILMSREKYKKHLTDEEDFKGEKFKASEVLIMTDNLPTYFWLAEFSIPDLYTANKHKILDFIYVCDKKQDVTGDNLNNRWIQIRLPGACYFNKQSPRVIPLFVKSHYPLYRHEKDSKVPEW